MKDSDRMRAEFGDEIANLCKAVNGTLVTAFSGTNKVFIEDDDIIHFYMIHTKAKHQEVRDAVAKAYPYISCNHDHDRYFRQSVISTSAFDREGVAYYIVETLARNI